MISKITLTQDLNALFGIVGMIQDSTFPQTAQSMAIVAIKSRIQDLAHNAYVLGILDEEEADVWYHKARL